MAATCLAEGTYVLRNVPAISDVDHMGDLLASMGMTVTRSEPHELTIVHPPGIVPEAPYELVERMRASIVVLGPLLARFGRARVALPGGDDFGPRPIDMHLRGLEQLGAAFESAHGYIEATTDGLVGTRILLEFPSVGATENALMAAVLAKGHDRDRQRRPRTRDRRPGCVLEPDGRPRAGRRQLDHHHRGGRPPGPGRAHGGARSHRGGHVPGRRGGGRRGDHPGRGPGRPHGHARAEAGRDGHAHLPPDRRGVGHGTRAAALGRRLDAALSRVWPPTTSRSWWRC